MTAAVPPRARFSISLRLSSRQRFREDLAGVGGGAERDALGVHPPGAGDAQPDNHGVGPAVVGPAHLDHHRLAAEGAGAADGGHDGLRARAQRPVDLDAGQVLVDQFGQPEFVLVEQPGHRAALAHHLVDPVPHRRVVAAEDRRTAGLQEVDVGVAVEVGEVGALRLGDGQRERVVEREVVLDATGDALLGPGGDLLAAHAPGLEVVEHAQHRVVARATDGLVDQRVEPAVDVVDVRVGGDGVAEAGGVGTDDNSRFRGDGPCLGSVQSCGVERRSERIRAGQWLLLELFEGHGGRDARCDALLLGAELADGDLADRRGHRVDLVRLGHQGHQVGDRDLLEQAHGEHGPLGVGAEHHDAVVGEDERVAAGGELLAHVLREEAGARRRVVDDRHLAAQEAALLVGQGRDRAPKVGQRGREGLVGVDDGVDVGTFAVDRRVHAGLDRRREL